MINWMNVKPNDRFIIIDTEGHCFGLGETIICVNASIHFMTCTNITRRMTQYIIYNQVKRIPNKLNSNVKTL